MSKKNSVHFLEGESTPNINLIIKDLIALEVLQPPISSKDWIVYSNEIILNIKDYLKTSRKEKTISIKFKIKSFNLEDSDRFSRVLDDKNFEKIEKHNRDLVKSIIFIHYDINKIISRIFIDSLNARSFGIYRRFNIEGYDTEKVEKIEKSIRGNRERKCESDINTVIKEIDLNKLYENLKNLKKKKIVEVKMSLTTFLSAFLSRIDILTDIVEKGDLIRKFEIRKDQKIITSRWFLGGAIGLFIIIFVINIYLYCKNISLPFSEFLESFLGQGIYLFFIESLLVFLAFYFLSLYRSFLKIIEMYDSHILLIESDFFYKNDRQFQDEEHRKELFQMRKENTQKIHMLPEKTFKILLGEKITKETPTLLHISERILELLKSLVSKK